MHKFTLMIIILACTSVVGCNQGERNKECCIRQCNAGQFDFNRTDKQGCLDSCGPNGSTPPHAIQAQFLTGDFCDR